MILWMQIECKFECCFELHVEDYVDVIFSKNVAKCTVYFLKHDKSIKKKWRVALNFNLF